MDSYLSDSDTVRESCLADIDGCDIYLLIVGHRYGFVPKDDNDERLSITQLEFRRARSRNKPCLALLRISESDTRLSDFGNEERMRQVNAFRNEVAEQVRAAEFSTPAEFMAAASASVMRQLERLSGSCAAEPAQKRAVPRPPLREPQQAIVGRADLVALVLAQLDMGTRDFAFEYLPGSARRRSRRSKSGRGRCSCRPTTRRRAAGRPSSARSSPKPSPTGGCCSSSTTCGRPTRPSIS